jgi:2-dehydropantoate 2-reductase
MDPQKICIVGAGAIGGFIGARLAQAGKHRVAALARGATLQSLRENGWQLQEAGQTIQSPASAFEDPAEFGGAQDLLIIAVKGTSLAEVAPVLAPLIGPHTVILPAMNGVPWWFCQQVPGWDAQAHLASVDADGGIARALPASQVLGCVVHASTAQVSPGVVRHVMGQGLIVGEPGETLRTGQFDVTVSADIRKDIWYKLWGNLTMNPLSAVTGATVDQLLDDPLVRRFCADAMQETAKVGRTIGCHIEQSAEDRFAVTRKLGAFKTSMLQDAEAARPLELDAIVTAVKEIAVRMGVATPSIDTLLGIARVFGQSHGLYPSPPN